MTDVVADACTIVSTRVIAARRDAIWHAFADPERLARWWGPAGFSNRIETFDLRVGGLWRLTMRGPDGSEYPNESVFTEVVPGQRLVFEHQPPHRYWMTMSLDDAASGGARVTWQMRHETVEACEAVRPFVEPANEQNLDRLEAELKREAPPLA
jgi:uncharacterized protein YndB with AHSA1/START domain